MRVNFNFNIAQVFNTTQRRPQNLSFKGGLSEDVFQYKSRPEDEVDYSKIVEVEKLSKKDKNAFLRLEAPKKNRALFLATIGTPFSNAIRIAKLEESRYLRANELLDKNINADDVEKIASVTPERYERMMSMFGEDVLLDLAIETSKLKGDYFEKKRELALAGFSSTQINNILEDGDEAYEQMSNLARQGVNSQDIREISVTGEDVAEYYENSAKEGYSPQIASALFYIAEDKKDKALTILNKFEDFIAPKEELVSPFRRFFESMSDDEVDSFISYIEKLDTKKLKTMLPEGYNLSSILTFANYHKKTGKVEFSREDLTFNENLTEFLSENFLNADGLSELLAIFPATPREVGALPDGWLNGSDDKEAVQKKVYEAIARFQETRKKDEFEENLGNALNKNVNVIPLESGRIGRGYRIQVDGAVDTCLKMFHSIKQMEAGANIHGKSIEPQMALFANKHSDDFVKMYFGKVAARTDRGAFIVTQYLDDTIVPDKKKLLMNSGVKMISNDTDTSHNMACGKIFDFGFVTIEDSSGKFLDGKFHPTAFKDNPV